MLHGRDFIALSLIDLTLTTSSDPDSSSPHKGSEMNVLWSLYDVFFKFHTIALYILY